MPESWQSRIKKLREALDLTQVQFAEVLRQKMPHKRGPHPSTVARWENGSSVPGGEYIEVMQKLARDMGLPDLFR